MFFRCKKFPTIHFRVIFILMNVVCFGLFASQGPCNQDGFKTYVDPQARFSMDYPATMTVDALSPDELNFSHSSASLRMSLDVIRRPKKASKDVKAFLEAIRQNLKEEFKDVVIISDGASKTDPSQLYLLYSFTDKRGMKITQLTQVYLADERILQLIISDKSEGFKNLDAIIDRVRNSLRISKPSLE